MANEKRLIDSVDEAIKQYAKHGNIIKFIADVRLAAINASTNDVAKVVHGHWVSLTECANAGVYCSVCNKKVYKEDYAWCNRKNKLRSNYCPNCGAKMDGDGNE